MRPCGRATIAPAPSAAALTSDAVADITRAAARIRDLRSAAQMLLSIGEMTRVTGGMLQKA